MKFVVNILLSLIMSGCTPLPVISLEMPTPTLNLKISTTNNYQKNVIVPRDVKVANREFKGALRIEYEMEDIDLPKEHLDSMDFKNMHVLYFHKVENDGKKVAGLHTSGECGGYIAINYNSSNEKTLAHEIGHALGLDHVDDKENIMGKDRKNNAGFNFYQLTVMRNNAFHLKRLCLNKDTFPNVSF